PSLCLFEGTTVSVGRGTEIPFEQWGHPAFKGKTNYNFQPISRGGATKPLHEGMVCYGRKRPASTKAANQFTLAPFLEAYQWHPEKSKFFNRNNFFEKLAGNNELRKQVEQGLSEEQIRATWQKDLERFRKIRKKYLLYPDFE